MTNTTEQFSVTTNELREICDAIWAGDRQVGRGAKPRPRDALSESLQKVTIRLVELYLDAKYSDVDES
ncbi:MAG TPA: hypothetical protein VLL82_15100 [Mycobacterium sp.]|nr:hypothetical protein [Mycobacterium sp.]